MRVPWGARAAPEISVTASRNSPERSCADETPRQPASRTTRSPALQKARLTDFLECSMKGWPGNYYMWALRRAFCDEWTTTTHAQQAFRRHLSEMGWQAETSLLCGPSGGDRDHLIL